MREEANALQHRGVCQLSVGGEGRGEKHNARTHTARRVVVPLLSVDWRHCSSVTCELTYCKLCDWTVVFRLCALGGGGCGGDSLLVGFAVRAGGGY